MIEISKYKEKRFSRQADWFTVVGYEVKSVILDIRPCCNISAQWMDKYQTEPRNFPVGYRSRRHSREERESGQ